MSEQSTPILSLPVKASGAVTARRFVTPAGAQAGAGVNALGVARFDAADTQLFTADVLGTTVVDSGAAFALGAALEVDANGKAVTKAAGVTVARALQAATAADQKIEVLLIPN